MPSRRLGTVPWVSPHHGYHRRATLRDPVRQRIVDAAAVLPPGGAIGGWAAAYLYGVSELDGRDQPVMAIVPPHRVIERQGIRAVRAVLRTDDVTSRSGVRCTTEVRTAFDVLRLAPSLTEAVVAGDCLMRVGLCSAAEIEAYAEQHPRRRGLRQLRAAVSLLEPAAASPPETRLRLLCRDVGLPRLLVNRRVYDLRGRLLGVPDLLEPVSGLAIEYDGEYHRGLAQHTADNLREERLEAHGLAVVRVTSLDLRAHGPTSARLLAAHQRQLTNPPMRRWSLVQ